MLADFWAILDRGQRRKLGALVAVFVVNALLEFFSLGTVFALCLSILAPKDTVGPSRLLKGLVGPDFLGSRHAMPWLAGAVVAIYFVKTCIGVFANWLRARLVNRQRAVLSERLLRNYLSKDWPFFLTNNVSVLISQVTSNCDQFALTVLNNAAIIATELFVCVALAIGLAFVSPSAIVIVASLGAGLLVLLHRTLKPWMFRFGELYWVAHIKANRTAEMALGGAKEVMLYRLQDNFCERMRQHLQAESAAGVLAFTLYDGPRQVIELCAVATFIGFIAVEAALGHSMSAIALAASVFAAAAFRLLPSASRLSAAAAQISNMRPAFEMLRSDLAIPPPPALPPKPLPFRQAIELRGLSFSYPRATACAVTGVSVRIPQGSSAAIVGRSGAGKTTLLELLLGLLEASEGDILIDGARLDAATRQAWQSKIGYVPQHPFVCDDTVASNIAFGVPPGRIDMALVQRAAGIAGIAALIEDQTLGGYDTVVGDGGVMLSGGQRQRLAIARALYRRPQLLIFDEATSALDSITENLVNEAIVRLEGEMTLVIAAHRMASVRHCDNILVLDRGRLVQTGSFEELSRESGVFQMLLRASERRQLQPK